MFREIEFLVECPAKRETVECTEEELGPYLCDFRGERRVASLHRICETFNST